MKLSKAMRGQMWRALNWDHRAKELEEELSEIPDATLRSAYLYELGALCEYMIPDRQRALWPYGRAWKATERNTPALIRARQIYEEVAELEMVANLAQVEYTETSEPDFLALAGEALLDARKPKAAIPVLERALESRPHDIVIKDALAVAKLIPGDLEAELDRLQEQLEEKDPIAQARLRLRIARTLWLHAREDPRLRQVLEAALQHDPTDERSAELLQLLFEEQGLWSELVSLYQQRSRAAHTADERVDILRRGGLALASRLAQPDHAVALIAEALTVASDHNLEAVPGHLAMLVVLREAWIDDDLAPLLRCCRAALAGKRSPDELLSIALFAGLTAWKVMGNRDAAVEFFDIAKTVVVDHPVLIAFHREADTSSGPRWVPVRCTRIDDETTFQGFASPAEANRVFVATPETLEEQEWVSMSLLHDGAEQREWEVLVMRVDQGVGFVVMPVDEDEDVRGEILALINADS